MIKTWQEFYKLPLKLDEDENGRLYGAYAWTHKDNNMALTFDCDILPDDTIKKIAGMINGTYTSTAKDAKGSWTNEGVDFFYNGTYYFCVRGWGGLTGTGGLNLPQEKAEKIQDDFVEYILKQLNND